MTRRPWCDRCGTARACPDCLAADTLAPALTDQLAAALADLTRQPGGPQAVLMALGLVQVAWMAPGRNGPALAAYEPDDGRRRDDWEPLYRIQPPGGF